MRNSLPGITVPLRQSSHLPTVIESWKVWPTTIRERLLVELICVIKDKPDWERKVFDNSIIKKWRDEALQFEGRSSKTTLIEKETKDDILTSDTNMSLELVANSTQMTISEDMFTYAMQELKDDATDFLKTGYTPALSYFAIVYETDTLIDSIHQDSLRKAVRALEKRSMSPKDWHPGSDDMVWDLVHPSLYPLVYGKTKALLKSDVPLLNANTLMGYGETVATPDEIPFYSKSFQWLPCDVTLKANATHASITSYINNLPYEQNIALYSEIEHIIARVADIWAASLASTMCRPVPRLEDPGEGHIDMDPPSSSSQENGDSDESDEWDIDDESNIIIPEPIPYSYGRGRLDALALAKTSIMDQMYAKGLQVIVKLANIELTPQKPVYGGGSWHVEGQLNEHICASALYYFDSTNISDSFLAFREQVDAPLLYNNVLNNCWGAVATIYSIKDAAAEPIQFLGKVLTRQGRLLVFPNVLQHRVSPFELVDKTVPGHRKLLALFLVDPFIRIPSTANIPPQQAHWWSPQSPLGEVLAKFPPEVADTIVRDLGFPITLKEAHDLREELMEERKASDNDVSDHIRESSYNFCEH